MLDNDSPSPGFNGPSRESVASILQHAIDWHKTKLAGLEHLLKIAERIEIGSPAEVMLWRLLQSNHNSLFQ